MITTIKPKVSVILTFANGFEMTRYALESILWQTLQNFEVWFIGDEGNSDFSKLISMFQHDARIHICHVAHHDNEQQFEAIKRSRGEYIAYLKPGHIWLPDHLRELADHIDDTRADIVLSMMQAVYSESRSSLMVPVLPDLPSTPEPTVVMHKKSLFARLGMDDDLMENFLCSRELLLHAQRRNLTLENVPAMTAVKFPGLNIQGGALPQQRYIEKIRRDQSFIKRELSSMLIRYDEEFRHFPSMYRLFCIMARTIRMAFAKVKVDHYWRQLLKLAAKRNDMAIPGIRGAR